MADGLLNKASIILTPTGYKAGTLYNVAPVVEPYEDFDFARASVASRVNSSGLVEMVGRTLSSELVQNGDFSQLGSELVTNGDYSDAGVGNAISQSNGVLVNENNQLKITSAGGAFSSYARAVWATGGLAGDTFVVEADIISISGSVRFYDQSNNGTYSDLVAGSTYKRYIVLGSGDKNLGFGGNNDVNFELVLDNVSVKQVDPNDYWTLTGGWSIADNKLSCDGTNDSLAYQSLSSLNLGDTLKVTYTVSDYTSGTLRIGTGAALQQPSGIARTSSGTYVEYITKTDGVAAFGFRSYSFNGSIDNISVKEVIDTNNIPRISYDSNGDNGHILLEPTSTNLVTYSEDFSQTSFWNANSDILTPVKSTTIAAPDGSYNAWHIVKDGTTAPKVASSVPGSASTEYTKSIWARTISGTGTAYFGEGYFSGDGVLTTVTTEWQRIEITVTQENFYAVDFRGSSTLTEVLIWGAQMEQLSYATSYIPTLTGSTETRATETATGAGSADLINSTEGVLYAEIAALENGGANRYISLSDNTTSNRLNVIFSSNTDRLTISGTGNIGSFTNINFFSYTQNVYNKIAIKYSSSGVKLFVNGSLEGSNSDNVSWTSNTLTTLDFSLWNQSTAPFEGKVKALAVFNEALSDDELT